MMGEHRNPWTRRSKRKAARRRTGSHGLVAVGAIAISTVAWIQAPSTGAATGPYVVTPPDLQIEVPTDAISIGTNPTTGDRQLQFTHVTWDAGTGPFEIKPHFNRRTGVATFQQTIYRSRTGRSWRPAYRVPLAVTGVFDPPSDYRFPLTRFTLNQVNPDGSLGTVVATSPKTDYCITADTFVGGVPNAPNNTSPPQSNCTSPNKALGFSVGWGDQYDQTDNGQPIDLTGVPDGTYVLHAMVDPLHVFTESNPNNDVTDTTLQIAGNTVTVVSQTGPTAALPKLATSVTGGTTTSGTLTLEARVLPAPRTAIASVRFLLDGEPFGAPAQAPPYVTRWALGNDDAGMHTMSAQVTDSRGATVTAPARTVDVKARAGGELVAAGGPSPSALLVNPVAGQVISGTVPVAASVRSAADVRSAQFVLDGRPLGRPVTTAPYAVAWNTTKSTKGRHTLSVQFTDVDGATGSSIPESVDVSNPAPPMTCFVLQAHVSAEGEGNVTTPKFHTAAPGETLVAFVSGSGPAAARQPATVSGAGLSWRMAKRASSPAGEVEIWTATAPRVLAGATIDSRLAGDHSKQQLSVIAMEGVDGVGASTSATGTSGSPTVDLKTSKSTSLVFALAEAAGAEGVALPPGWVRMDRWTGGPAAGASWTEFSNQPTGSAGAVVKVSSGSPTASPWSMVAVELVNDGG
jgi:hypothetical protein